MHNYTCHVAHINLGSFHFPVQDDSQCMVQLHQVLYLAPVSFHCMKNLISSHFVWKGQKGQTLFRIILKNVDKKKKLKKERKLKCLLESETNYSWDFCVDKYK